MLIALNLQPRFAVESHKPPRSGSKDCRLVRVVVSHDLKRNCANVGHRAIELRYDCGLCPWISDGRIGVIWSCRFHFEP
jgi:hypothetical protein